VAASNEKEFPSPYGRTLPSPRSSSLRGFSSGSVALLLPPPGTGKRRPDRRRRPATAPTPTRRGFCDQRNMEGLSWRTVCLSVLCAVLLLRPAAAIRFVIDREECFSHNVEYEGDTVHVSFVVIKAETPWHYSEEGVDLVVKDPNGAQVRDSRDKTSDKFEFIVQKRGVHRFCFTNKSPYHETIDFDVHVGHFSYFEQHAKDEHFAPLFEQIAKLDEALYNIQFEQHWLEAQTDRQAILNENMSRRAVHKALFESAALIAASVIQVYLLRRLFERKLGSSRV